METLSYYYEIYRFDEQTKKIEKQIPCETKEQAEIITKRMKDAGEIAWYKSRLIWKLK